MMLMTPIFYCYILLLEVCYVLIMVAIEPLTLLVRVCTKDSVNIRAPRNAVIKLYGIFLYMGRAEVENFRYQRRMIQLQF